MRFHIEYIGARWCGACKTIKPAVEQLAKRYGVELKSLDYDEDLDDEAQAKITKVPTVSVISEDRRLAQWNANQIANLEHYLMANVKLTATEDF